MFMSLVSLNIPCEYLCEVVMVFVIIIGSLVVGIEAMIIAWKVHELGTFHPSMWIYIWNCHDLIISSLHVIIKSIIIAWSVHEPCVSEYSMWISLWSCHDLRNYYWFPCLNQSYDNCMKCSWAWYLWSFHVNMYLKLSWFHY